MKLFGAVARIYVRRDVRTQRIRQLVLPSYHTQSFFYKFCEKGAIVSDISWNIAASMVSLETNSEYFSWRTERDMDLEPRWETLCIKGVSLVVMMVWWEKSHDPLEESRVKDIFSVWLLKEENEALLDPSKGSMAKQIHYAFGMKGCATRRTAEYKQSEAGER